MKLIIAILSFVAIVVAIGNTIFAPYYWSTVHPAVAIQLVAVAKPGIKSLCGFSVL